MDDGCVVTSPVEAELISHPRTSDGQMSALLIDGEERVLDHLQSMLQHEAFHVSAFVTPSDAIGQLRHGLRPDVAFINPSMDAGNEVSMLKWFHQINPTVPAIALSCSYDPRTIVDAVKMGAADVLVAPIDRVDLRTSLKRCRLAPIATARKEAREITLSPDTSFVISSDSMKAIAAQCELLARSDLPVLILGETGTGKEVLAQYMHKMSNCSNAPFLKVNCAAMPTDLLESELLGYEQGAFTGAVKSKPGKFELCDHGTIFLDEIGEMSPALQAKLLQVLQDGTFSRLGGRSTIKVNVRVIAATNIDIKTAIRDRRFREDLYYRINGFSVCLPPLRERKEEIPVLIRYFMQRMAQRYARRPVAMTERLLSVCMQYPWPGNLRELECFVKRFLVLADEEAMMSELAVGRFGSPAPQHGDDAAGTPAEGLKRMLSSIKGEAEAKVIAAALQENQWKRKKTAARLQISYKALLYKMKQYGIVAPPGELAC